MNYLGDFKEDSTIRFVFCTNDADGAVIAPSSAFEAADYKIYKNTLAAERANATGFTVSADNTGTHCITIDTSDNTVDGFFAIGNDYFVVLDPDETVDGQVIEAALFNFSIENRSLNAVIAAILVDTIAIEKLLRADKVIDTGETPWVCDYKEEGTEDVLMSKTLKNTAGENITNVNNVLGQLEKE